MRYGRSLYRSDLSEDHFNHRPAEVWIRLSDIIVRNGERSGSRLDACVILVSLRHGCVGGSHELDKLLHPLADSQSEKTAEDLLKR